MFGQASIVSPAANAFAIPIISLLVVPLSILGALLPFDFILYIAHQILVICMLGLNWLADLPFATWQQAVAPFWAVGLAMVGVLWVLLPRGIPQRWLGFVLMLPMLTVESNPLAEGEMQVIVLDVGQGLSVVIKTATHVMVYDTGKQYSQESDAGANIVVPYLRHAGIKAVDALVVSHDDNDHSGGVSSILQQVPVNWIAASYTVPNHMLSEPKQQKQLHCYAGQTWRWDGVRFEVLSPSAESYQAIDIKDNDRSCVIKVSSQYGTLLLTGDIEEPMEETLIKTHRYLLKSDVVIVPHHGSKTSSTAQFVKWVGAKHAVFTVGYLNHFKHPKPLIVSRYLERRSKIYRSDYHGAILIDFLEKQPLEVRAWRLAHSRYWHDKYL
jgi:competence protein ComEC